MSTMPETPLAFDADELRSIAETLDKLMADSPDLGIPKFAITGAAVAIEFESVLNEHDARRDTRLRPIIANHPGGQS